MARLVEYSDGTIKYEKRARKVCLDRAEELYKEIGHLPTQDEWQRKKSKVGFTLSSIEDIFGSYQEMIKELLRRPEIASREEERKEMGRPPKWTEEDLLDALYRASIEACGDDDPHFITQGQYDNWCKNSGSSEPRALTIGHRFGSWSEAITAMQEWRASQEEDSTLELIMSELEGTTSAGETEPALDATPDPEIDSVSVAAEAEPVSTIEPKSEPGIEESGSEPELEPIPMDEPKPEPESNSTFVIESNQELPGSDLEASEFTTTVYRVINFSSHHVKLGGMILEPSDWSVTIEQSVTYKMASLDEAKKVGDGNPSLHDDTVNHSFAPIGEYEKHIEWTIVLKDSAGHEMDWPEASTGVFYLVDSGLYHLLPQEARPANMVPIYQTFYPGSYPPGLYVYID